MNGFSIIINDRPIGQRQHRHPKSKKRRIRKKWAKRPENFKPVFLEQPLVFEERKAIICTSSMAARLRRACVLEAPANAAADSPLSALRS